IAVAVVIVLDVEQPAVQVRHIAAFLPQGFECVRLARLADVTHPPEENIVKPLAQKVFLFALSRVEKGTQIILVALKLKPTLLLYEVKKHQAIKQALGIESRRLLALNARLDLLLYSLKHAAIVREKLIRDGFNVERRAPLLQPTFGIGCIGGKAECG